MPLILETLAHKDSAASYLGDRLFEGSLTLVLGAGSGKPLGLPTFEELLNCCFSDINEPKYAGDDFDLGATQLSAACKKKSLDVKSVVAQCLYKDGRLTPSSLMGNKRMGALGAMLMGSRRGTIGDVVTFNYDSALEEYLLLHGYVVKIVTELPTLTGSEDVTIYHPHGYLPSETGPGSPTDEIIFTKESINKRVGDRDHPWWGILKELVRSKVLLLLGISEGTAVGTALGPLLAHESIGFTDRPAGFLVNASLPSENFRTVLYHAKVVPVGLGSYAKIDEFLLDICRNAAKRMISI